MAGTRRPGATPKADSGKTTEYVTVYKNPLITSGYDPDGIQSLLNEDTIDWDGFDWDDWSWVAYSDSEDTPTEGGTEINYDYYKNDPWYNLAFDNLDMKIGDEGLTEENLQEATKYLVETFRSVMNNNFQESWDSELPESWEPKEMTTSYKTPFEIPAIVKRAASPSMGAGLSGAGGLYARSDAKATWHYNNLMGLNPDLVHAPGHQWTDTQVKIGKLPKEELGMLEGVTPFNQIPTPQPGFEGKGAPKGFGATAAEARGSEKWIGNVQKILNSGDFDKITSTDVGAWQAAAGVGNINSKNDSDKIKKVFREHKGILPVKYNNRGMPTIGKS